MIGLTNFIGYSQEDLLESVKVLYESKQYDEIISEYSANANNYSAKVLYYVGIAYYFKSDFDNFLKIINLSIRKDKSNPDAFFYKASFYNYKRRFSEAIKFNKKAIKLEPNKSKYLDGLADTYFITGKFDQALKIYKLATTKEDATHYPFIKIPEVYLMKNDLNNALKSFYIARDNISKESTIYIDVLYNIAKLELHKKNYAKAEITYKELAKSYPTNFNCYKLIQAYFGKKEYEKVEPFKQIIYQNQAKDTLNKYKKKWFRYDYFFWKRHRVFAFEKFTLIKGEPYYQHKFYVLNENGKVIITFLTKNSPISFELSGSKYLLTMDNNKTISTFSSAFKKNFDYEELRKNVIRILNKKDSSLNKFRTPIYRVQRR